ncbi:hypothetical protein AZ22_3822 [Bordetella bronchiseptica 980-2]|uniref:Uncharacterized protein n=1 Tax=Bordetella bronchiseptica 00-P-2796 TaxID=1331199 RepID=A0ABR4RIW7_BORBO|nr:hypothetical protein AZ22_3822 [Bordetella bronchiseptica 980-2]KCV37179.1 hypothetical protein L490_3559 [Bordetella bronchiseptica 00-P-2796]KCV52269.1 hypothetical protein L491_3864 [Bordetella bronchiseptica 3E44]KCV55842.1 hypothetical protein AZ14_3920 [Bordetella bronchiseptica 980]KDB65361.1 hypothetical protein AZ16_3808 [Bordetella bronchiseptica B18-5 (C3)]KDB85406.1 hypothetical protein AZ27_3757 [Bordetella bronchiseptica D756]KDB89224.1 hypothetical protein AZ17_3941 [Bordete
MRAGGATKTLAPVVVAGPPVRGMLWCAETFRGNSFAPS